MVKFLIYIVLLGLFILGIYALGPDSGYIEIHSKDFYIETSLTVFCTIFAISAILLALLMMLIVWVIKVPARLKSVLDNYAHKRKIDRILDITYLVWNKKMKEAAKKYNNDDFEIMHHPLLDEIQQQIYSYKKKSHD